MFYEICYETGRTSVAFYENDAEAKSALSEHHRRAVSGEAGGPLGGPAERISKVYIYDKHPNELNPEQTMSADVLTKDVTNLIKAMADENGVVPVDLLAMEVRALTHPMVNVREDAFASIYRMKESKSLDLAFLAEVE